VAADIANEAGFRGLLQGIGTDGWLPVLGVVHAAAAIEDKLAPQLDLAGLDAAFRPKILGALVLDRNLADQPLQFFVCCSSLGALLGQAGQANYAAANAFLDAFVHHRRARSLPALGANWGGWYGVGFAVTPGGQRTIKSLEQRGILGFSAAQGTAALGLLLGRRAPQAVVMRLDWTRFRKAYPEGEEPSFLAGLPSGAQLATVNVPQQATAPGRSAGLREQLLALNSGAAQRAVLEEHLKTLLADVLRHEVSAIDTEKPMGAFGLDSLMGFELKNRCEQRFGLTLSATMVWNYPTVAAMAEHLADKLGISLAETPKTTEGDRPALGSAASLPSVTEVVAGVEQLSEDEALRALLKTGGK
jgi:myxalamid-type polyketide synthase MxaE and MxaD